LNEQERPSRPITTGWTSADWVDWTDAFAEELEVIKVRRGTDGDVSRDLVGLAFSGGGIRSATFGLGVLEALKHGDMLKQVDYLSTVSGGGYIGAWLSANCNRNVRWMDPNSDWKLSIDHLRRFSNYLSPIVGFVSADTWSMAMIWIRNTMLVQLTVILAIAVALLVPRLLFRLFMYWPSVGEWRWLTIIAFLLGVVGIAGNEFRITHVNMGQFLNMKYWLAGTVGTLIFGGIAWAIAAVTNFNPFTDGEVNIGVAAAVAAFVVLAAFVLQPAAVFFVNRVSPMPKPEQVNYSQGWVQKAVVLPMTVTAFLVGAILWHQTSLPEFKKLDSFGQFFTTAYRYWPFPLTVVFVSMWLLSFCSVRKSKRWREFATGLLAPLPAKLVLYSLLCTIMLLLHRWNGLDAAGKLHAFVFAPPMVLCTFSVTVVMLMGMMGRQQLEGVREWWSRAGAWFGIYGFAWLMLTVAAIYGPLLTESLFVKSTWTWLTAGVAGWIGTTAAGVLAGNSGSTSGEKAKSTKSKVLELVVAVAPFVFITGLLLSIATSLHFIIVLNSTYNEKDSQYWTLVDGAGPKVVWAVLGACLVGLVIMASRVDINEFSLNAFYRSRLVRCYLGATRPGQRNPQRFTNFDDDDDLKMADLVPDGQMPTGPFHIVNCSLNLGGSSDLSVHTRHSAVFTITPLRCGTRYFSREQDGKTTELGYRQTRQYGGVDAQPSLGQAISVSGAAASPNMGYHTSPVVAFLMTLFNARLAWWFPNPSREWAGQSSPWFSLSYLGSELFGGADDKSAFLSISDGGHFENLAAYELVKRRCRVVIISDAECDPGLNFEGLGTLIRMCEVDFGAIIDIDVRSIRPAPDSAWSTARCAVGIIRYNDGTRGTLIYLKASMTGHEDTSVLQYKAARPAFPHESTSDQFYKEDQFESYRTLGRDIGTKTFEPAHGGGNLVVTADKLVEIWSPALITASQFTNHSTRLMELWSELSHLENVEVLDAQLNEGWPARPIAGFRSAFYLCSEILQLMENVYLDLRLEETWNHPDNTGWQNQFRTWAQSLLLQQVWSMTAGSYGRRFRYFCERELKLPLPEAAGAKA
jgi:hypothetical protein